MVMWLEKGGKSFYFKFLPVVVFLVLLFLLIGSRGELTGADTNAYLWQYHNYDWINYGVEQGLYLTYHALNRLALPQQSILYFFAFFYLMGFGMAIYRYSNLVKAPAFLIFFILFSLFFFNSMGINVIRQGLSLGLLLLAFTYLFVEPKNRVIAVVLVLVALSFHFSSVLVILFMVTAYFTKKMPVKFLLMAYGLCIALAAANLGILEFKDSLGGLVLQEGKTDYLTNTSELYTVGFKPQFVAFNTVFLGIFLFLRKSVKFSQYDLLLRYYIIASCFFFLAFQIPYSDRWGLAGWVTIPFLLAPVYSRILPVGWMLLNTVFLLAVYIFFTILNSA